MALVLRMSMLFTCFILLSISCTTFPISDEFEARRSLPGRNENVREDSLMGNHLPHYVERREGKKV